MGVCVCVCACVHGFTFLVRAHPGSPGQRAVKWVCVCVCVRACMVLLFWYRLTWVVPDKGPLNVCVCVRACVCEVTDSKAVVFNPDAGSWKSEW